MGFQYYLPGPPLDKLIAKVWDWDMPPAAHRHERVLPQPGAQLIINLHEDETRVYTDDAARRCIRSSACVLGGPRAEERRVGNAWWQGGMWDRCQAESRWVNAESGRL